MDLRALRNKTLEKVSALEGKGENTATHNITSDRLYSKRWTSTNEQSYKLITHQAERAKWESDPWRDDEEEDNCQHQHD